MSVLWLAGLLALAFCARCGYVAWRAVRTGAFETGERVERATRPRVFWLRVARVLLVGSGCAAAFVLGALDMGATFGPWLVLTYVLGFMVLSVLQAVPEHRDAPPDRAEP